MLMEIAGLKIAYRDLVDLKVKMTDLLETFRKEREAHDQESERIRKNEKSIQRFLGQPRAAAETATETSNG